MTSILLGNKTSLTLTAVIVFLVIIIGYLQSNNFLHPLRTWRIPQINISDAIIYASTLFIIFIVAWLFNKELEKSLHRAVTSEKMLTIERDQLEERIQERTVALKETQQQRIAELNYFAEFGRQSSSLFHDLLNPLTAQIIHLEKLHLQSQEIEQADLAAITDSAAKALKATKRMEKLIQTTKEEIADQSISDEFVASEEIRQAVETLAHKARLKLVEINLSTDEDVVIRNDSIKFYKIVLNLVSNAIDSYETMATDGKRMVEIVLTKNTSCALLTVEDFGCGIAAPYQNNVFTPLFTTKDEKSHQGLGLSICKNSVEKDFHGTIVLKSEKGRGTKFTITIPLIDEEGEGNAKK
jgi:two-component system C4-dicarboxylate transport sensor histidine kinase DctB